MGISGGIMSKVSDLRKYLLDSKAITEPELELLTLLADTARINNAQLATETGTCLL